MKQEPSGKASSAGKLAAPGPGGPPGRGLRGGAAGQAGFSLVEVILAIVLTGVLGSSLIGMLLAGGQGAGRAREDTAALELARGKMEELLAGVGEADWGTGGWSGSFPDSPGYSYYVRGEDFAGPPDTLRTVTVTVYAPASGGRKVELTTLLPRVPAD